ncbi:MAG TPA: hypothetical protein VFW53_09030, partial [Gallionella sp.]|nr:hypothetical protein [Gallionella sp.]
MSIKLKMLATLLLSQFAIAALAIEFGNSAIGWGACLSVALISLAVFHALVKSSLLAPLEKMRAAIQAVKMEGNLALRVATSNAATDTAARTFNELLDNFQSIVGKVMFNSGQVATSAQSLQDMARQVASGSQAQQQAAEAASQAIAQM